MRHDGFDKRGVDPQGTNMSESSRNIFQDGDSGVAFRVVPCKEIGCQSNDNNYKPISGDIDKEELSLVLRVPLGQLFQSPANEI